MKCVHQNSYLSYITKRLTRTLQLGFARNINLEDLAISVAELREREAGLYGARKGTDGMNDYFTNVWSMARRQAAEEVLPEEDRGKFLQLLKWAAFNRSILRYRNRDRYQRVPGSTVTTGASWARGMEGWDDE